MNALSVVQDVLIEGQRSPLFTGVTRRLDYRLVPGKAFVCIGVRRAGKSTVLHQIMDRLQKDGTPREDMIYVNLFDDRLEEVRKGRLDLITEAYFSLYPEKKGRGGLHCFLDEAQMAAGWEAFADRLMRAERMRVYVTGSSARLLSREVSTAMRGRALTWELFPFSFGEFLDARRVTSNPRGQADRLHVRKAFQEYWEVGGFPETLDVEPRLRVMIHQDYFKTMVFRDVVDRNDALHPRAVRDAAYRLLNSAASMYSINAVTGYLKSLGHKVSKTFVGDVIEWFEDAYALFSVRLYDASLSRQNANPRKIYVIDHALVRSSATGILTDSGHLLENLVFLDGRRRGRELYYYRTRNGREVDFAWRDPTGRLNLAQVTEQLSEGSNARERELSALREALEEQPGAAAVIVTRDEEEQALDTPAGPIRVLPVWRHLIESEP